MLLRYIGFGEHWIFDDFKIFKFIHFSGKWPRLDHQYGSECLQDVEKSRFSIHIQFRRLYLFSRSTKTGIEKGERTKFGDNICVVGYTSKDSSIRKNIVTDLY